MKTILSLAILLSSLMSIAQTYPKIMHNKYEPAQVQYLIAENVDYDKSIDTITFENVRYIYKVKVDPLDLLALKTGFKDSILIGWELNKKEKLFYRPFTVLGIEAFSTCMGSMLFFTSINAPTDKKLHALAGWCITGATSAAMYYWTGKKWVSVLTGLAVGCLAGIAKEAIWDKAIGLGNCDNKDAYVTFGGAFASAFTVKITLR